MAAQPVPDPTDALLRALLDRLGPDEEIVIRRRADAADADPIRLSARRVVDMLGVPRRLAGHRCMVEALCLLYAAAPERPKRQSLYADVAARCLPGRAIEAVESAIQTGIRAAAEDRPEHLRTILGVSAERPWGRSALSVLLCLLAMVQDDVAQGGGR